LEEVVLRMLEKWRVRLEGSSRCGGPRRMMRSEGRPAFLAAARAVVRLAGWVTRAFAPESRSWKASSSAV
jgi:hypothetical protein